MRVLRRPRPTSQRPGIGDDGEYLQWVLRSVTLTDEDGSAICALAASELGIEPFYVLERFRSTFTFPVKTADTSQERVYQVQRAMRRITAEVLVHNEPAFERIEQITYMRQGDTTSPRIPE